MRVIKRDVIKDFSYTEMQNSFASAKTLVSKTFSIFRSLFYCFMGDLDDSVFLIELWFSLLNYYWIRHLKFVIILI